MALEKLSRVRVKEVRGTRRRIIRAQPHAWPKPISMPRIIRSAIRKTGTEAVAAAADAPERYAASRWSVDYAALGMRGDPRGRKSGAGPGVPKSKMTGTGRGEKRFRSATRNP